MIQNDTFYKTLAKIAENLDDGLQGIVEQAIQENNDTIFEAYIVDDYLWGYDDSTAGAIPGDLISETQGLYYGVSSTTYTSLIIWITLYMI